jgi:hypothetical protein
LENNTMTVTCIGIDAGIPCGVSSNVDFVHFVCLNNDMLGFRRHALTFLPDPRTGHEDTLLTHGHLLCLRHYSVASMGWSFVSGSVPCMDRFRENLRPLTGRLARTETCACNICRR